MSLGVKDGAVLNRKKIVPRQEDYKKYMEKIIGNISNQDEADKEEEPLGWIESSIQFNSEK